MKKLTSLHAIVLFLISTSLFFACNNDNDPNIPPAPPTVNVTDSLVMVDFFHSMKGEECPTVWDLHDPTTWGNIKFIKDEATGLKYVYGIYINRFHVTKGSRLPESLGKLERLAEFVIEEGPGLEGQIPESLYDCPLKYLYLHLCPMLQGPLSPGIGKLANTLEQLSIQGNPSFRSELPGELGQCKKVRYICLWDNDFYGEIPIGLRDLNISPLIGRNHFSSIDWRFFTEDIGFVPSAAYNDFVGEIPQEVLDTERWKKDGEYFCYPFNKYYGFSNYVKP